MCTSNSASWGTTVKSLLISTAIIRNYNFVTEKEILDIVFGKKLSDPHVFGTIEKVLKRPFQWSLNHPSIIFINEVMKL